MGKTVIGSSIVVDGDIDGEDDLVVHGTVKGKISIKQGVIVERTGQVDADIEGESVRIAGQVAGKVSAKTRIEITSEGRMVGDVRAPRVLLADGAHFKGNVDMD